MPRGIKKESSDNSNAVVGNVWETAIIVGYHSSAKAGWKALVMQAPEQQGLYQPNVVRLGRRWYIAYYALTENA